MLCFSSRIFESSLYTLCAQCRYLCFIGRVKQSHGFRRCDPWWPRWPLESNEGAWLPAPTAQTSNNFPPTCLVSAKLFLYSLCCSSVFSASCNLRVVASTDYCTPRLSIALLCSVQLQAISSQHYIAFIRWDPHLGQLKHNNFSSHLPQGRKRSCFIALQLAAFKNGGLYCEGHPALLAAGLHPTRHGQHISMQQNNCRIHTTQAYKPPGSTTQNNRTIASHKARAAQLKTTEQQQNTKASQAT